jgi:hypothetical protein
MGRGGIPRFAPDPVRNRAGAGSRMPAARPRRADGATGLQTVNQRGSDGIAVYDCS